MKAKEGIDCGVTHMMHFEKLDNQTERAKPSGALRYRHLGALAQW